MIQKNWQELIKPTNLDVTSEGGKKAKIVVEPLERGFGLTLGNALRRVLLSSLQGGAVTAIKINGVLHEFSVIPGVREDVTDIVLNIKCLAVAVEGEGQKTMYLKAEGPCTVTAAMIETGHDVEIKNQASLEQPIQQCSVTYLYVTNRLNDNYLGETGNDFTLARGAKIGMDKNSIAELYPEMTELSADNYEYSADGYTVEIQCYDGEVDAIRLRTERTGDWVDVNAYVTGEPPEYSDAAFLSDYALDGFSFTFNGTTYDAPLTIKSLLDSGWTMERAPQSVPARSYATVYLRYDVRTTLAIGAYNYTNNAIEPAYGFPLGLSGLEVTDDSYSDNAFSDPAASFSYRGSLICTLGDSKAAVRAAAEAAGLQVTENENAGGLEIFGAPDSKIGVYVYFHQDKAAGYNFRVNYEAMDISVNKYSYEEETTK